MTSIKNDPKNSFRGWYSTEEEIRLAIENKKILNPMLDLTNACNLNCPYCYIEEKNSTRKKRLPHELTLEETLQVIDVFHFLGAKTVDLVGAGEPTIDPHFKDIVTHIHALGMTTSLFTNGIKISKEPEFIDFLFHHDVTVIFKVNSFNPEVQDIVAGKKGYTADMISAFDMLVERGFNQQIPTRLSVNTIAFKGNFIELPLIHRKCREYNIHPITGDFIPTGRTEDGQFVAQKSLMSLSPEKQEYAKELLQPLSPEERVWLRRELQKIDHEFGIIHSGCPAYYGGSICTQQIGLYVDIQGNVWPCVARGIIHGGKMQNGLLGNIRNGDSLKAIWYTHPYMIQIRKNFDGSCPYKAQL